jgi:uncharacterized protein (TIGR00255 family)
MKSMTGFGRASADLPGGQVVIEIRTVNHRSLDIKLRSRELDGVTENALVAAVRGALKRGSVSVNLEIASKQASAFDQGWYEEVARSVQELGDRLGIASKPDLSTIAAFAAHQRESHDRGTTPKTRVYWDQIAQVVDRALLSLEESRTREGSSLRADVSMRLARLGEIAEELGRRTAGAAERASAKLSARVTALLGDVAIDSQRLAQEVAFIADRADVTEELVRLRTHLQHFKGLVEGTSPESVDGVGRRMDFWLQEIGREFNTLASKSQDSDLSVLIVDAKSELEKIREQAQNIE